MAAIPAWAIETTYSSFHPGTVWLANDNVHIDCHGGNIVWSSEKKKFYWYGEHYGAPAGVACYSSIDLYNWTNEGVVLQKGTIQVCERPKVIYSPAVKKYVMWFHYDNSAYSLAHLAVATADSATGPFSLVNHFLPNGHQSRDIGMFTDTTGKTYILYAADQNSTVRMVALTADYTNITASDTNLNAHCEGPGMFECKGSYYLISSPCLGWTPGQASWYSAKNAMGGYSYKGDPSIGDSAHTTFNSQPCFIFKVPGYSNAFIYMGDRWNGSGNKNSQYVFLPVAFSTTGAMQLHYYASWNLGMFTPEVGINNSIPRKSTLKAMDLEANGKFIVYDICGKKVSGECVNSRSSAFSFQRAGIYIIAPEKRSPVKVVVGYK
jgi:hypothetical protein